jgi:hypothetical protein
MSAMVVAVLPWKKTIFASRLRFVNDYSAFDHSGSNLPLFF